MYGCTIFVDIHIHIYIQKHIHIYYYLVRITFKKFPRAWYPQSTFIGHNPCHSHRSISEPTCFDPILYATLQL